MRGPLGAARILEGGWRGGLVLFATLAGLTACGAGDSSSVGAWRGEIVEIEGVEVVRHPGSPLFDSSEVEVLEVWRAPSEAEGAEHGVWEQPIVVRASSDRVYVLDRMAHRVYVVEGADGRWVAGFGRRGRGPGELERPFGLALVDSGVVVGNSGRASLERFTADGEYEGSIRLDAVAFGVEAFGERLLVSGLFDSGEGWRLVELDGEAEAFEWPDRLEPVGVNDTGCERFSASAVGAMRVSCYQPYLQVVGPEGERVREIVIDQDPIPVESGVADSVLAVIRAEMVDDGIPPATADQVAQKMGDQLQDYRRFQQARADTETERLAIWEQITDDLGGGPATLHIVSESGVYLARVNFTQAWKSFDVHDGRVYALEEDETTGLVTLAAYEITLPEALRGMR